MLPLQLINDDDNACRFLSISVMSLDECFLTQDRHDYGYLDLAEGVKEIIKVKCLIDGDRNTCTYVTMLSFIQ